MLLYLNRNIIASFAVLMTLSSGVAFADEDQPLALIIGNSAYQAFPRLGNPSEDATMVAAALKGNGFTIFGGGPQLDLNKASFERYIHDFTISLHSHKTALFYYAGHGIQVKGINYLIPVTATFAQEVEFTSQLIPIDLLISELQTSGVKLSIIILDACRDNPFSNSAKGARVNFAKQIGAEVNGLAPMQAPAGTIIAYATEPGRVAMDGKPGENGPYAQALISSLKIPDLGLLDFFNDVGLHVAKSTGGLQKPWFSASPLEGHFVLRQASIVTKPEPAVGQEPLTPPTKPAQGEQPTAPPVSSKWLMVITDSEQSTRAVPSAVAIPKLDDRNYYRLEAGTSCRANDPSHTNINSWAGHVSFSQGQALIWGRICNDNPSVISLDKLPGPMFVRPDLSELLFQNEHYEYYKEQPKLCDSGTWCPVEKTAP